MRADTEIDTLHRTRFLIRTTRIPALATLWAIVLLLTGCVASALAQDATPEPATCDVDPRPITFIADVLAAPKPEVTPTPVAGIPDGIDVTDPDTRAEVGSVVETLIACVNEGEILRAFSLYDDEFLRRLIDPEGFMREDVAIELAKSIATPEPVEAEDQTVLDEILLVRETPDGTMIVVFQTSGGPDREPDETQIDLFALRHDGERWLIVDGLTDLDPEAMPTPSS